MDMNKLTMKSQAALAEAQQQAVARNHQQIEPEHVLFALLGDAEGIVYPLLHHVGANPAAAPCARGGGARCAAEGVHRRDGRGADLAGHRPAARDRRAPRPRP